MEKSEADMSSQLVKRKLENKMHMRELYLQKKLILNNQYLKFTKELLSKHNVEIEINIDLTKGHSSVANTLFNILLKNIKLTE